jgi:hypothetical protein
LVAASQGQLDTIPDVDADLSNQIQFLYQYFRNKKTVTNTIETMFKDDEVTPIGTALLSDDGTTFIKNKMTT